MTKNLRYFCTLLLMAVVGVAWADEETLDFSAQGYANQQEISTVEAENFSVTFNKGTNSNAPKYYTTGTAIRAYGGNYFTVSSDNTITGITITFGSGDGSNAITTNVETYSNGTWSGSANSVTFTVGGTSGNRRIASITVTYTASGSSTTLEDNDLALTGAPVALTFDLYDNAEPQVINYTTSSTGAVTIPASNFFETAIDETNKTITVTPVAVTNGVKEAAVNQAADDTYKAGSASFTVDITDSTPFEGGDVTFDAKTDFGNTTAGEGSITKNGVIFSCDNGILGNGNEYRLYKNSTITFSTTSGSITKIVFICKSGNPASGFGEQTGFTLDGNNGIWVGDAESISFVASNKQVQATQIVVTVTMPGDEPSITLASYEVEVNANAHTTPTTIAVTYANIDFENHVPEVVFYESDGSTETTYDWLFVDLDADWNVYYTVEENTSNVARTAYFKVLGYDSNANNVYSNLASITQAAAPVVYTTIPGLFAAATSTATPVTITFNNWVISAVKGSNAYLTDNAGNGLIIYQSGHGFNVNDVLSGTASCNLVTYQGSAELTALTASTEGLTVTAGGTVTEQNIAINELGGVNTGALLAYENLTFNGTELVDADNNAIEPYSTLYSYTFEADKVYNIKGVYLQYNTTKEILPRSADDIEEVVSDEPSITVTPNNQVLISGDAGSGQLEVVYHKVKAEVGSVEFVWCNADGTTPPTETYELWLNANLDDEDVTVINYTVGDNDGPARTAYFKIVGLAEDTEEVVESVVSFTQHQFKPDYAYLPYEFNGGRADIENENGLTQEGLGSDYNASSNPTTQLKFDGTGDCLVLKINPNPLYELSPKAITFNIKGNSFSGGTFAVQVSEDGETYTDLAAYTDSEITSSNQTFTLLNTNDNVKYIKWVYTYKSGGNIGLGNIYVDDEYLVRGNATVAGDLTLDECTIKESGKLTIKSGTLNVTNTLTNEATSEAWNNLIIEDGGQLKISNSVNGTVLKNITGYSSYTGTGNGGYYLIATPATLDATGQTNMFPSEQSDHQYVDFYGFDQTMVAQEWRNYKYGNASFAGPLGMEQGEGYLYASKNDVTLTLKTIGLGGYNNNQYSHTDYPFVPTNVDKIVEVSYNAEGINGQEVVFKGYNLIGNPFTCKAYLADDRDFYRMNEAGDKIVVATDKAINVAEGIFVIAESGETNVTFTTTDPTVTSTGGVLNITLSQAQSNRGNAATIDAARIRFGEGRMLPKFNFMGNNGGISIPQGSKDYAVVRSQGEGELPVNFKADKNGAYTLSIRPENVEMDYLHLIDNLTGTEVDLLATPTYTFNAKKTDYASRFRLVFSTTGVEENGTETNASFAFFNGSEWVVNANDTATLEVIDMMGRTVLCKDVARNVSTNGWAQGVYVIRLTDNNSVKTQKIVVK